MPRCSGQWESRVKGKPDGILDLTNKKHKHDNVEEPITVTCTNGLISIRKANHLYMGEMLTDYLFLGFKAKLRSLKLKPFDEPTDGAWTAQGPVIIKTGRAKKAAAKRRPAKKAATSK